MIRVLTSLFYSLNMPKLIFYVIVILYIGQPICVDYRLFSVLKHFLQP